MISNDNFCNFCWRYIPSFFCFVIHFLSLNFFDASLSLLLLAQSYAIFNIHHNLSFILHQTNSFFPRFNLIIELCFQFIQVLSIYRLSSSIVFQIFSNYRRLNLLGFNSLWLMKLILVRALVYQLLNQLELLIMNHQVLLLSVLLEL
ncbi:uncharacterized protein [Spinacia oleracea]|uniref:Transmembrane protein n=1 Tax=Spinacia oleracea TaxID=3562 RepID=A0ABM3R995_SPIOL|nr:uncharacterized protein LOC130467646 [Spinacia oleracea]